MTIAILFGVLLIIKVLLLPVKTTESILDEQRPIVETNVGKIRGIKAKDDNYASFMGIPYAHVNPENVFGNAVPEPPFEEIFDAIDDSARCPQFRSSTNTYAGSLDCLTLNIYVPEPANTSKPLPVMVYIFGGTFQNGHPGRLYYAPKYIVRHDVILVTINYRLGPYGFLCLAIPEVSGNQGLKDQALAFEWVQRNIKAFGGDPDRVTIFGSSSGAMSVDLHIYSNFGQKYKNVIIQSGYAINSHYVDQPNSTTLFKLAELFEKKTNDVYEALSFLNQIDPQISIERLNDQNDILESPICVEENSQGAFLTNFPVNVNNLPHLKDISIMMGVDRDERSYISTDEEFYSRPNFFRYFLESGFDFDQDNLNELEHIIRNFYTDEREVNFEFKRKVADFRSDTEFFYPAVRTVQKYSDNDAKNLFFYVFSYHGKRNFFKRNKNITDPELVVHADELGYLFDMEYMPEEVTPEDQLIIDRMTTMWTNFAKDSNPTPQTSTLLPVKWEPISRNYPLHYLAINTQMSMNTSLYHSRMAFWDLFYGAYGKYRRGRGYIPSLSA